MEKCHFFNVSVTYPMQQSMSADGRSTRADDRSTRAVDSSNRATTVTNNERRAKLKW